MRTIHNNAPSVNYGRGKAYFAHNSRNVAGIRFGDTLRSIRNKDGILRSANALAWDAGVVERAQADGITCLEVVIRNGSTYRTTIETLLEHGSLQYRFGRQWVMSLRFYSIDGAEPSAERMGPDVGQLALFGEVAP